MWIVLAVVAAVYFLTVGTALLLWPRRLLNAAERRRRDPVERDDRGASWRPSRRPDAASRPESVNAMRAVGVLALGLAVVLVFVVVR